MPDNWRWTYDDNPSDLSIAGGNFDNRMLLFAENEGVIEVDVPFDSTETDAFYSPQGEPWARRWPAGTATVKVDVTQANSKITLDVSLQRVGATGVFKQGYGSYPGAGIVLSSTGVKTFTFTCTAQDADPTDRLRLLLAWTRDNSFGGDGIVRFGFGEPATDYCEVPILMSDPIIVWDGETVTLQGQPAGFDDRPRVRGEVVVSSGQVVVTQSEAHFDRCRVVLANFDDAELAYKLYNWWAWAARGKQFAFALDGSDTIDTTLDGAAAAGQKVIPLTSTTGIQAGKKYRIRSADGVRHEQVHVDSISAGVSVTARDNLHNTYASGDAFRSVRYFPKLVRDPQMVDMPVIENQGLTYTLDALFMEDRG
jgi:hypothetical protein